MRVLFKFHFRPDALAGPWLIQSAFAKAIAHKRKKPSECGTTTILSDDLVKIFSTCAGRLRSLDCAFRLRRLIGRTLGTTEANVVAPVAGPEVVAVRRPRALRGDAPTAATQHPVAAF